MSRHPGLLTILAVAAMQAGCAVCASNAECAGSDVCVDGACVPTPPPRVTILSPLGPVGDTFEVALELGFRGGEALVTMERSSAEPGEPCLPFPPVIRRVAGDVDAYITRVVVISGLPSLGPSFSIVARVDVNGTTQVATHTVNGPPPPADIGGMTLRAPGGLDVDVLVEPLTPVAVVAPTPPVAFVEATVPFSAAGEMALPSPRLALAPAGDTWAGAVPALRGPQVVWVEATIDGVTRRCGRGLVGGPDEIEDDELEVLLVSRSLEGDNHLVELSTRLGEAFCDGRTPGPLSCRGHVAAAEGAAGRDGVVLGIVDGLLEVAAVPRLVSGPVEVMVRVSRGDRHVAVFGPMVIQPALGESWVAGRVHLADGDVRGVVEGLAPPSPGLPW